MLAEGDVVVPSDLPDPIVDPREVRIDELLVNGNRLIQEARDERAAHAKTRLQLECVTAQFLAWRAALHRTDPAWRQTCES